MIVMAKMEPAATQLYYQIPNGASYIDLARDLSRVNRRMYRQGMIYAVQDIQVVVATGMKASDVVNILFSTIPNTWVSHNACRKGFRTWRDMQNDYMDGAGADLKGKWADFKVYLDDAHAGATKLDPYAGDSGTWLTGEWIYSNFVYDDAGTSRSPSIHMLGTSTDDSAIGLVQAYGDARNRPTAGPANPAAIATGFCAQYHGVGDIDDELGNDLRDDNDLPPYDDDEYPGGATNGDAAIISRWTTVNGAQGSMTVPGFIAPCGLIQVSTFEQALDTNGFLADASTANGVYAIGAAPTVNVIITVAPGPYRGVLATPMGQ